MTETRWFSLFFILLALLLSPVLSSQSGAEKARQQLQELRNGALLVRLQTRSQSIAALENAGLNERTEQLRQEQYEINKEIILSFSQAFDFAPVYFFYSDDSDEIREGNFEGNVFDSNRNPVPPEKLKEKPIYTGEFGKTPNTGIEAFILMDQNMQTLESPFPFYQRRYVFLSLMKLSKAQVAERLNEKLHNIYDRWFKE